jgi:ankyrin repeat protein/mono/diheme cytochrome c family protein
MFRTIVAAAAATLAFALPLSAQSAAQTAAASGAVDYERDVRPILAANCFGCHGPRQAQSGLRLDLRQNAMRGGDYGVVIVPGKSTESKLIKRLIGSEAGLQMPPTGPLPKHEIDVLRAWIDAGAEMPGRAVETAVAARETSPAVQRLIDAIAGHDLVKVKALLADDRNLAKSSDASGASPLMHGAATGTVAIMQALLDAGADVTAKNTRSATALHWAVSDAAKVKLLLLAGAAVDAKTTEGRTPLYAAATIPAGLGAMRHLLEAGADANAATLGGATPLFPAVNVSAEMTRLLLDKGANPNRATRGGVTPILFTRDAEVVSLLVARGADVKARSKVGETALMDAAARGDLAAAKILLERGDDVNAVDHRGYTPLILAAQYDRDAVGLIRLLLDRGADITATAEGETALSWAARRGETEVTRMLRAAAAAARATGSRE